MLNPTPEELLKLTLLHAANLNIESGVAAIVVVDKHDAKSSTTWLPLWLPLHGQIERKPDPSLLGDVGINHFGFAFAMIAEMLSSGKDSGPNGKPPKQGEVGYLGGITWEEQHFSIFLAFSGGTEEQNLACVNFARYYNSIPNKLDLIVS